jgi:hypothetical protein
VAKAEFDSCFFPLTKVNGNMYKRLFTLPPAPPKAPATPTPLVSPRWGFGARTQTIFYNYATALRLLWRWVF